MKRCAHIMNLRSIAMALLSLTSFATGAAESCAADLIAPPVMYAPHLWQGKTVAVIRVLRRVDSHIEEMSIPVGQGGQYKTLHLQVEQCVERPPTLPRDSAARLSIRDDTTPDFHFDGWIVQNAPALSTYTNPLYGVSVVRCEGGVTAPLLAPLSASETPVSEAFKKPENVASPNQQAPVPQLSSSNTRPEPVQNAPLELNPAEHGETGASHIPQTNPEMRDGPLQLAPP